MGHHIWISHNQWRPGKSCSAFLGKTSSSLCISKEAISSSLYTTSEHRIGEVYEYWEPSIEEPRVLRNIENPVLKNPESIENPVLERSLYIGSTLHTTSEPGIRGGYKGSPLSPLRTLYWRSPPKQFLVTQHQNLVLEGCTKAAHCAPPQNSLLQGSTQAVSHNSPRTQYWRYVHNLRTQYWRGLPFYT